MKKLILILNLLFCALGSQAAAQHLYPGASSGTPAWVTDQTQQMPYTCVTTIWIDPLNGSRWYNTGTGTQAHPYLLPEDVNGTGTSTLGPGTCINLINDAVIYDQWTMLSTQRGNANTPTGYIVIRSTDINGNRVPAVDATERVNTLATGSGGPARWVACCVFGARALNINASDYVILDGIDWSFEGIDQTQSGTECVVTGASNGGPNTTGPSHTIVRNNYVHGCGGGGIIAAGVDFFIVQGNVCSGAATSNGAQESCFSSYQARSAKTFVPTGYDNQLIYHQVFSNNVASDAYEAGITPGSRTDGNCFILDDNMNTQNAGVGAGQTNAGPYPYRTLVANNVFFHCGGKGIQIFLSQHVDIINNSLIRNNYDAGIVGTYRGEISANQSLDMFVINNVVYSVGANTSVRVAGSGTTLAVDDVSAYLYTNTGAAPSAGNTIPVTVNGTAYSVSGVSIDSTNASVTPGGISGVLTFTSSVSAANGAAGKPIVATNSTITSIANNSGLFDANGSLTATSCTWWSSTCSGSGTQTIYTNSASNYWENNLSYAVNGATTALTNGSSAAVPPTTTGGSSGNVLGSNPLYQNAFFTISPAYILSGLALNAAGSGCAVGEQITLAGGTPIQAAVVTVDTLSGSGIATFHVFSTGSYPGTGTTTFTIGSSTGSCTGATFKSATFLQPLRTVTPPVLTLQAGSPGLSAGNTVLFPPANFQGQTRPATVTPNIGAY